MGVPECGVLPQAGGQRPQNAHAASGVSPTLLTAGLAWPASERGWKIAAGGPGLEAVPLGGGPVRKLQKMTELGSKCCCESPGEVNVHLAPWREAEGGRDAGDALRDFPPTS